MKPPPYLYRYRSLSDPARAEQEFAALEQAYLWFSKLDEQNDDLEKLPWLTPENFPGSLTDGPMSTSDNEALNRWGMANVNIHQLLNETSICCFSDTPINEHLWTEYADIGGICIKYNANILAFDQILRHKLMKVNYVADRSSERIFEFNGVSNSPYYPDNSEYQLENLSRRAISTKTKKWSLEREWRCVISAPGPYYIMDQAIDSVLVDSRCSKYHLDKIVSISKYLGFKVFISDIKNRTYSQKLLPSYVRPRAFGRQQIHEEAIDQIKLASEKSSSNIDPQIIMVISLRNCDEIISCEIQDGDLFVYFTTKLYAPNPHDIQSCKFLRKGAVFDSSPIPPIFKPS